MATRIAGRFLVQRPLQQDSKDQLFANHGCTKKVHPILASTVSLSFWGGIDPLTGIVVDSSHPLAGQCVSQSILCLPSGRGSCTASQVLLELIRNGLAPRAIVLRDLDGLACVGALVAAEIFDDPNVPDIVLVGNDGYSKLLEVCENQTFGVVSRSSEIVLGSQEALNTTLSHDHGTCASEHNIKVSRTVEEEELLKNAPSKAERMALNVLFRYARLISDAPAYVPVNNAHIDGCTYIGPGGLEFVQLLVQAGGKVKVPTTLNSMSTDRRRWQQLGVPPDYARNSIALGDAYMQLGCQPSFTCAPYLLSQAPTLGQDVAWGESNAVVFANSVVGARTEKYADYLDICCAITGLVPAVGVHLPVNRLPTILLDATQIVSLPDMSQSDFDLLFPVLGHLCGSLSDGKVPILIGLESWSDLVTIDHLKAFCAAFGTTGSSPLIHIAGITPEALDPDTVSHMAKGCDNNCRIVSVQQLQETFAFLDSGGSDYDNEIKLVALGNPHLSTSECDRLAQLVQESDRPKSPDVRVVACISRTVMADADPSRMQMLQDWGMEFVNDTCWCMLLDPPIIPINPGAKILTNSGKYSHYGPGLTNRAFRFGSMEDCVQSATTGVYLGYRRSGGPVSPSWLTGGKRQFATLALQVSRRFLRF